jgi:hypothetical protein
MSGRAAVGPEIPDMLVPATVTVPLRGSFTVPPLTVWPPTVVIVSDGAAARPRGEDDGREGRRERDRPAVPTGGCGDRASRVPPSRDAARAAPFDTTMVVPLSSWPDDKHHY